MLEWLLLGSFNLRSSRMGESASFSSLYLAQGFGRVAQMLRTDAQFFIVVIVTLLIQVQSQILGKEQQSAKSGSMQWLDLSFFCLWQEQAVYCYINISVNFHMGASSSEQKSGYDIDIMSDYKQLGRDSHGIHLLHHQTHLTYLLKEFTYASDLHYEQERYKYEREVGEGVFENVLSVSKVKTHTIHGLCSTTYKIFVIYEYPRVTLQDEIVARQKEEKRFDEHQLWSILQSCNVALSQLKPVISLNCQQVFITPEGLLKVIHNDMIDENYRYNLNQKYFYAPEKIRNFTRMDTELGLIKESVFSMGMTLLQAALLEEYVDCYDFDQRLFLQINLGNLIQSLTEAYSSDFIEILQSLLAINPADRPAYHEIQRLLDNFWSHQVEEQKFQSSVKNGESLNIQGELQKKIIFTSQEQRGGIYNNLATINSHQKDSIRIDDSYKLKPALLAPKAASDNEEKQIYITKPIIEEPSKRVVSPEPNKENCIYTDPRLLEMIKKDLQEISKLKQSTLKQTIKYSFLYPQTESVFSSIKDVKLTMKHDQLHTNQRSQQTLKEINSNKTSLQGKKIQQFKLQQQFEKLKSSKECFIEKQNEMQMRKMRNSLEKIQYFQGEDEEGRYYQGQYLNGKKNGWGKLLFADGAFYEGQFKNNEINGRGILYYTKDKPAYDGMWVNQQFHGQGILYNEHPYKLEEAFNFENLDEVENYWIRYEGQFYEDSKQGKGKLFLTNGETIEGHFTGDSVNGQCKFTTIQGRELFGAWEDNRLVQLYSQQQ